MDSFTEQEREEIQSAFDHQFIETDLNVFIEKHYSGNSSVIQDEEGVVVHECSTPSPSPTSSQSSNCPSAPCCSPMETLQTNADLKHIADFFERTRLVDRFNELCFSDRRGEGPCHLYAPCNEKASELKSIHDQVDGLGIMMGWKTPRGQKSIQQTIKIQNTVIHLCDSVDFVQPLKEKLKVQKIATKDGEGRKGSKMIKEKVVTFKNSFSRSGKYATHFLSASSQEAKDTARSKCSKRLQHVSVALESMKVPKQTRDKWNNEISKGFINALFDQTLTLRRKKTYTMENAVNPFRDFMNIQFVPFMTRFLYADGQGTKMISDLICDKLCETPVNAKDLTALFSQLGNHLDDVLRVPILESKRPDNIESARLQRENQFMEKLEKVMVVVSNQEGGVNLLSYFESSEGLSQLKEELRYLSCDSKNCCEIEGQKCKFFSPDSIEKLELSEKKRFMNTCDEIRIYLGMEGVSKFTGETLERINGILDNLKNYALATGFSQYAKQRYAPYITQSVNLDTFITDALEFDRSIITELTKDQNPAKLNAFVYALYSFCDYELRVLGNNITPGLRRLFQENDIREKMPSISSDEKGTTKISETMTLSGAKYAIKTYFVSFINALKEKGYGQRIVNIYATKLIESALSSFDVSDKRLTARGNHQEAKVQTLFALHYFMLAEIVRLETLIFYSVKSEATQLVRDIQSRLKIQVQGNIGEVMSSNSPISTTYQYAVDHVLSQKDKIKGVKSVSVMLPRSGKKVETSELGHYCLLSNVLSDSQGYVCSFAGEMYLCDKNRLTFNSELDDLSELNKENSFFLSQPVESVPISGVDVQVFLVEDSFFDSKSQK